MTDKFLDYSGVETLWKKIRFRYDKKLDSVTNHDDSIEVTSDREIAVKVSSAENNLLTVTKKGLFAKAPDKMHTLAFGKYRYDGSEDVNVEIYDGRYEENN